MLYYDNMSYIMMDNSNNNTDKDRHIQIQNFDLQEWVGLVKVVIKNTSNDLSPSDVSTKSLGCIINSSPHGGVTGNV